MIKTFTNITTPNITQLFQDIQDSEMTVKSIQSTNYNPITLTLQISFSDDLTSGDETILSGIVSDNNNYTPSPYKITGTLGCPMGFDINHFGLHRRDTINVNGSLIKKEYFKNYNPATDEYSDLVVEDTYTYTIDFPTDLVQYRDEVISWYREDETIGCTKSIRKYYDLQKAVLEGCARRENLIDAAKAYGFTHIEGVHDSGIMNYAYFFNTMLVEVQVYLSGTDKQALIDFISNSTETFLTQDIKDNLVSILDYWST